MINVVKPELELIERVFIDVVKLEVHLGSKVDQIAQVSELVLCISWWWMIMITLQEQGGYLVSFLLCINPLDTAVHLLCSSCTFLHFWSFANPQNPASYFPDRDAAKKPTIHFLTNIYMFKFRQLQFSTWKNTFNKIKNTHVFFFI